MTVLLVLPVYMGFMEMLVVPDASDHHLKIRLAKRLMGLHVVFCFRDVMPRGYLFEQAQIGEDCSWGAGNAGAAVNKNILLLGRNKSVDLSAYFEQFFRVLFG